MTEPERKPQTSVIYAEVNGFVEKKLWYSVDYLFVVEIFWSDNRTTFVKRKYKEFVQFHKRIKDYFRSKMKSEEITTSIWIPNIKGTWPFQKVTRDLAEKREEELHNFLKQLLQGDPTISSNNLVIEFFMSRPSDPVPYSHPQRNFSGHGNDVVALATPEDEYVLFTR